MQITIDIVDSFYQSTLQVANIVDCLHLPKNRRFLNKLWVKKEHCQYSQFSKLTHEISVVTCIFHLVAVDTQLQITDTDWTSSTQHLSWMLPDPQVRNTVTAPTLKHLEQVYMESLHATRT
jgi:hypothetical protein